MFRFKFESLLNHRRHEEEVAQKLLSEALRDLRQEQARLKSVKKQRRDHIYQLKYNQTGDLALHEITLSLRYIAKLGEQVDQQQAKVQQAKQRVSMRQQALISAVKKRKIFEKLKENDYRRYQDDLQKKELKFMDEVAVSRHIRGKT